MAPSHILLISVVVSVWSLRATHHGSELPPDSLISDSIIGTQLLKVGIVIPLGPPGAWDAGMVESPAIWFDSTQHTYGMVYSGYEHSDTAKRGYKSVSHP